METTQDLGKRLARAAARDAGAAAGRFVRVSLLAMDSLDAVQRAVVSDAAPKARHAPGYVTADAALRQPHEAARDAYIGRLGEAWRQPPPEQQPGEPTANHPSTQYDAEAARQRRDERLRSAWKDHSPAGI